jgi:hypothetical protein
MDLVRDILDAQLVDENGRPIGRVDGILLELRDGKPPRFVAAEVGAVTLFRRIHPRLAGGFRALASRVSPVPMTPIRIPPETFREIGVDIELAVNADADARWLRVERWLSRHVVARLPWGAP